MPKSDYPYDMRYSSLEMKESVRETLYTLADSIQPTNSMARDEYFDLVHEMYPDLLEDDLWDTWREWYDTV